MAMRLGDLAGTRSCSCLTIILASVFLCAMPAFADGKRETISAGALLTKVSQRGRRLAVISRGKAAGLRVGDVGELFPRRKAEGAKRASIDFNVRLAKARIISVDAKTATMALDAIAGTIAVGDYFEYKITVPSELARSALFRLTAMAVELQPQFKNQPYITVESLLRNPSRSHREAILDRMVTDIKAMKATIAKYMAKRIEEGRYHGQSPAQIVTGLDRDQIRTFLLFVEAFPGRYIGHTWKMPEVFMTWAINGTPSGDRERKLRAAASDIRSANEAIAKGKLDEARRHYQTVLRKLPDHKKATRGLTALRDIQVRIRRVRADPDDTKTRYQVMDDLFDLGAYGMAMQHNQALRKRKYRPFDVERYRGYILVRQRKWRKALRVFKSLSKKRADSQSLRTWLEYTKARARLARVPSDTKARLWLAESQEKQENFDSAIAEYRRVLENKRATRSQRHKARKGQERISLKKQLAKLMKWARGEIEKHDLKEARKRIGQVVKVADRLEEDGKAGALLAELATLARSSDDEALGLELFQARVSRQPTDMRAHTALAFALMGFDRLDEAERIAKKALTLRGDKASAFLILANVARARGDLTNTEKYARRARKGSPRYPWPLAVLARVEAAKSEWRASESLARKALTLERDAQEIRRVYTAVRRGQRAHEALQGALSSPRERLRLIRALATLGLPKSVRAEIPRLPATGSYRREAWWALAASGDSRVLLSDRLEAAHRAKPVRKDRQRRLEILQARSRLRSSPKDAGARLRLARLYVESGSYDTALAVLGPLMKTPPSPAVGDLIRNARKGLEMDDRLAQVSSSLARNDAETALRLSIEAQGVLDAMGGPSAKIRVRLHRADALALLGRYQEAIRILRETHRLATAEGNPINTSIVKRRIGRYQASTGTQDAFRRANVDALKLCEELDEEECLYFVHRALATIEMDEGRNASAVKHARRAWKLAGQLGRLELARDARFQLADANLSSGRFANAHRTAKKLLEDSRKHSDVNNEHLSLMVLGAVAMMRGQGKVARGRFQEVYELGTRSGLTYWRALARRFEGKAWLEADHNPVRAAKALQQADSLYASLGDGWASEVRGGVLRDLADARLQAGSLLAARKAANKALTMARRYQRRPGLVAAQWTLAVIDIEEGKADEALRMAEQAVAGAKKTDRSDLLWKTWHALARAREIKGKNKAATEAYEEAIRHLGRALLASGGDNEREGYMSTGRARKVYKDAIGFFLKRGASARAMEILELSRDAQLKQAFNPTKIETKDKALRARLDRVDQTRARIRGLEEQLGEAMGKPKSQRSRAQMKALGQRIARTRTELKQVVLDLKLTHRRMFQALAVDPQNLVARRKELPKDAVLVEYFVAADSLYAFVVSSGHREPAVVRVKVGAEELEATIAKFREAIQKEPEAIASLGRKLGDWLLSPLRPHLRGAKTLIVMPFGPLYYLPFDALVVSAPGEPLRYAIEDLRISVQTGTTLENLLDAPRSAASGSMLAVSNPDGTLPGANREVRHIVRTALPDATVLRRKQATVKKFQSMAGSFRYLHLATHGILDRDPRKTHLKMADGPLTVHQIAGLQGLDQSNELVVLSACDTAVEKGKSTGDELVSLAFAFAMAGSPALVASLWEVNDNSTAELMAAFYRALEQNSGDRLDALRNAKLKLLRLKRGSRKPFAAPKNWASFQLYGDFR